MQESEAGFALGRSARLGAAVAALESGRFADAAATAGALLAELPFDTDAVLLLGLAAGGQGDSALAARLLDRAAHARPTAPHPCRDLAELLGRHGRAVGIADQYRACLALDPAHGWLRRDYADHLLAADDAAEAVAVLDAGLLLNPDDAGLHHVIGLALAELGRFADALAHARRAVEIDPEQAESWVNRGTLAAFERHFDEALDAHDHALALRPDEAQVHLNRAVALLKAGRLAEGFEETEWRLKQPGYSELPLARLLPSLAGGPGLAGRTVLVTHEQGFGDTLQFVRYVPLLAMRGARVLLGLPPSLVRLLRGMAGVADVLTSAAGLPDYDFHCPMLSLARAFGTALETIPTSVPYLFAPPELAAAWAGRLPSRDGQLLVGLVWAGQARPWFEEFRCVDQRRSLALSDLAPLGAVPGARFVSLQHGSQAGQIPPPGLALHDPMAEVADFADTAAIIANLDVVVSVDTAVAHLAGALGKPVFLLDRYDNCWRWLTGRTDSPWYPTLRIFRQERPGEWAGPVGQAAAALAAAPRA